MGRKTDQQEVAREWKRLKAEADKRGGPDIDYDVATPKPKQEKPS